MAGFEDSVTKTLKLLQRNRVRAADIARYAGIDLAKARRVIDRISLEYPLYEVRRGVYGLLPKDTDRRPRGILARLRTEAGLSPSGY
jgi:hypothetical protein